MVVESRTMSSGQILRRNLPGTKAADFCGWPDQGFDEMDSTLAVQQYIQQTIRQDCRDISKILLSPEGQDEGVWKYEHLRQFCLELNGLAVKLQMECSAETCSQMTATEQWIFLCAAHKAPKECPAIDYTRHTLDGAASLLNSNKYFPSRVSIKDSSVAKLGSVCRRVYRIFSHAYYHHRHIFDEFEEPGAISDAEKETVMPLPILTQKQEDDSVAELPSDDVSASAALSSTIIEASSEENQDDDHAQKDGGFGDSSGPNNFSTLKIAKNADKTNDKDIKSDNTAQVEEEASDSNIDESGSGDSTAENATTSDGAA